ncbi:MAG: prepilin-type N-terminal cleavage/methylation domain-containing protein [Actinomycetota bacterium]|nr:prepilin-type N-terminal cleavage/methylation domain-containing protein [Actinomycetota bacterium]
MHARDGRDEAGFTLVELLVVVAVIGILATIAVTSLLGAQGKANRKAAASNLRVALVSAKTLHTEEETYLVTDAATTITRLGRQEPGLTWQAAPATASEQISVASDPDTAALATKAGDGHCYYVVDDVSSAASGTMFGRSAATAADCPAVTDTTAAGITWATSPKLAGW